MNDHTIDVVCPVILRDVERFELLVASMHKFWRVPGRFVAAVPRDEIAIFRRFESLGVILMPKDQIIGPLPYTEPVTRGWFRQQMVKLGFAALAATPVYMAIDADCFLTRETRYHDLVRGDTLPWSVAPVGKRLPHYDLVAKLLDVDESLYAQVPTFSWQPPFFFDTVCVLATLDRLQYVNSSSWQSVLKESARTKVRGQGYWTEAVVYHLGVLQQRLQMRYRPEQIATNWAGPVASSTAEFEQRFCAWDPATAFAVDAKPFSIFQGFSGIPAARIRSKLAPFLDLPVL